MLQRFLVAAAAAAGLWWLSAGAALAGAADAPQDRFTVTATPVYTLSTTKRQSPPSGDLRTMHDFRLDWSAGFKLTSRDVLFYQHQNNAATLGAVGFYTPAAAGSPPSLCPRPFTSRVTTCYPGTAYDRFDTYGVRHAFDRYVTASVGYFHRTRETGTDGNPGDNDPRNLTPFGYGGYFFGLGFNLPPFTKAGPLLRINLQALDVIHPNLAAVVAEYPPGTSFYGTHPIYTALLTMTPPPVFGYIPFVSAGTVSDYFLNTPSPEYYTQLAYGLRKPITSTLAWWISSTHLIQHQQGNTFPGPATSAVRWTNIETGLDITFRHH